MTERNRAAVRNVDRRLGRGDDQPARARSRRRAVGKVGFAELAFWLVAMRRPEPGELRLFEAVLVALADHGLTPSVDRGAAHTHRRARVAAGCARRGPARRRFAFPRRHRGLRKVPRESSPSIRRSCPGRRAPAGTRWPRRRPSAAAARPFRARPRPPVHKDGDPRTPVISAHRGGGRACSGPHLRLLEAIGRVHPAILGRTLPVNGAGVCGAALADLGFPVEILRGFALLARTAGLLGHLAEEARRPLGLHIYRDVESAARYVPPPG